MKSPEQRSSMLTYHTLDDFAPSVPELLETLRMSETGQDTQELLDLVSQAQRVARPKGVSAVGQISRRTRDSLTVNGTAFMSTVLSVNTRNTRRVFAFAATCGTELASWAGSIEDPVHHYYALSIAENALNSILDFMEQELQKSYGTGPLERMLPGSLQDWPIEEQEKIFHLLGDGPQRIDLHLTPSKLMIPTNSVSGLMYASREGFVSCQLCPLQACTHRRKAYDPEQLQEKYGLEPNCRKTST
jgi:hypothetical protein